MTRHIITVLGGASLLAIASVGNAQAPAAAEGATAETTEIIVTARRKDEALQDVPLVVNAVTAQTLEKLNIRDFKDIASVVPGLTLSPAADGIAPAATLRGVDYQVNNSGNNATVQFYFNDAPISAAFLLQSLFDVGQIEVLRGPQGTLRGIASPSGSITATTHRVDLDEIGGNVTGTVNGIGGINVNGAVNVPIIKGMLGLRVAGIASDDENNRVHSINNPLFDPYTRSRGIRATLRFDPTDTIDISGTYQHFLNKSKFFDQVESANLATGTALAGTLITPESRQGVTDAPRTAHTVYNVYNLQAQWSFAGQRLNYVGAVSRQHILAQQRDDGGNAFGNNFPGNASADSLTSPNLQNYGQSTNTRGNQQSHELRLSSEDRLFGMVDYVVGGSINRLQPDTDLIIQTPVFASTPTSATPAPLALFAITPVAIRGRSLERSLFGNVTVHIGEATEVSAGIRHIHFNNKSSLTLTNNGFSDFKTNVYSATIKHRFNENIMAYASTGSSWRVGAGTNGIILASSGNIATSDPALAALNTVTPEKSKSYEVGVKTNWLDKKIHLDATYYHQDFKNYIFSSTPVLFLADNGATPPTYSPSISRSGLSTGVPVKVNGVEVEFGYQPSRNFNIGGTLSYSLGKITNGQVPCTGAALPVAPKQINFCTVNQRSGPIAPFGAAVQSEYSHEITDSYDGFVRGQLTYFGKSQNDPTNIYDDVKAYGLVNLFAGVRDAHGAWELTGYVKNVFNTRRVLIRDALPKLTSFATFTGGGAISTNYRGITETPEREFGLTARFSFGSR